MGMFDSLYIACPECANIVEFQSKAGRCALGKYNIVDVPYKILIDLDGQSKNCKCGKILTIKAKPTGHII